jgi:hypothetical protein
MLVALADYPSQRRVLGFAVEKNRGNRSRFLELFGSIDVAASAVYTRYLNVIYTLRYQIAREIFVAIAETLALLARSAVRSHSGARLR